MVRGPYKDSMLLQQLSQRFVDDPKVFHKLPVVPNQSKKAYKLSSITWNWPIIICNHFLDQFPLHFH